MSLKDDLAQAIEKNLPSEVSNQLQERLALADRLEGTVADLRRKNDDLEARARRTARLDEQEEELKKRQGELDERERGLDFRERLSNVEKQCEVSRREDTWKMLELLLGNRVVREKVQRQVPVDMGSTTTTNYNNNGPEQVVVPGGESLQTTEETTEREDG